jgi:hydrogenase maturation protease
MDMFLVGQPATVAAVYRDLEGQAHVAVSIDAAGATDLHDANGRFLYFRADEIDEIDVIDDGDGAARVESTAPTARVLVAGIGNIFLGDDGFGPAVVQRLAARALPTHVRVEDFGIRGVHLAYEVLGAVPPYEITIIVDAVSRGGAPGTLYVIEPDTAPSPAGAPDAHALGVEAALGFLARVGADAGRVLVVGCEAASIAPQMGLSEPVAAALDGAVDLLLQLLDS